MKREFNAAMWISQKALNTEQSAQLMQQLDAHGVPIDMQWEYMHCMNPCKQICNILMVVGGCKQIWKICNGNICTV